VASDSLVIKKSDIKSGYDYFFITHGFFGSVEFLKRREINEEMMRL
jgi:hypothetical protein